MPKVLIAEDDLITADGIEEILVENGYSVCGIARTVAEAVSLGRAHNPDFVIIDLRLADGGLGTEIAGKLSPTGRLGILYCTGNGLEAVLTSAQGDACLSKPYRSSDLVRALEIVADIVRTGKSSPPYPRRFRVLPSAIAGLPQHLND